MSTTGDKQILQVQIYIKFEHPQLYSKYTWNVEAPAQWELPNTFLGHS